jgi:hypothetical protein
MKAGWPHRRLLAVIGGRGRSKALSHELGGMVEHGAQAAVSQIAALFRPKPEARAERRARQSSKERVEIAHTIPI